MSKKILLLGGSYQQVVAIKTAKALGYYTVLCDYLPDNPGQYVADKYYNVSTTDVEAVYKVAIEEKVDGVLAYASDPAAVPASIVCERMNLPTNPSKSVAMLGVKHLFRKFLADNAFACPKTFSFPSDIKSDEIKSHVAHFDFPIVVKPTDSSGSKGVSILDDFDKLEEALKWADSYSRNKTLIAEEFIKSKFPYVIGGDVFVWNGKIVLCGAMSCIRSKEGSNLIPIGEMHPSMLNARQLQNVEAELQRLILKLDIRFGELNIELLLDKDDNVHFLEVGPRAGGNMIPIQLSDIYGVDLVKANVLAAMGEDPQLGDSHSSGCFATYVLHSFKKGNFIDVDVDDSVRDYVYRTVLYKGKGDKVECFDGAGKACGIVFLRFPNEKEMRRFDSEAEKLIKVVVE